MSRLVFPGRRLVVAGAALAAAAAAVLVPAGVGAAPPPGGPYIVLLNPSAGSPDAFAQAHASRSGGSVGYVYRHAVKGYTAMLTPAEVKALDADPAVAAIVLDTPVHITAQTTPTGIDRIDGELSSTVSGNGSGDVDADVAIIDTGIGPNTDLNIVDGTNCVTPGGSFADDHGHGTHVAGTVAARDNADGVVGVAPGARLYAVKVLDAAGSGSIAGIICGIDWVTALAGTIDVANMSLGGSSPLGAFSGCNSSFDPMHGAICRSVNAGVTYAVAAGNDAMNANFFVPATYSEVITVSALADFNGQPGGGAAQTCRADVDDTFADFSNFGADVDLIAPGVCILSSAPGGGLATFSGTSMASPHVAGAAALYKSTHPTATPAQVKAALQAAGNLAWTGNPDGTQERLLNVDTL